ncbi:MAG: GNAT family N-acetyltransferase [Pseudomonadota bacterium]
MIVKNKNLYEKCDVTVTYLEQRAKPMFKSLYPPAFKTALMRTENISLPFYRFLFEQIGGPHKWVTRRYLEDEKLQALIHDPQTQIFVLYKEGWPAGFAEIQTKPAGLMDFKFFGLVPEAQGFKLGPWFLQEMLQWIWDQNPERVIIETASLDHPGALQLYQKMGFTVYDQGAGVIEWYG